MSPLLFMAIYFTYPKMLNKIPVTHWTEFELECSIYKSKETQPRMQKPVPQITEIQYSQ